MSISMGSAAWAVAGLACLIVLGVAGCADQAAGGPAEVEAPAKEDPALAATRAKFITHNELEGKIAIIEFGTMGCELSDEGLDWMILQHESRIVPDMAYLRVEPADAGGIDLWVRLPDYFSEKNLKFPVYQDPGKKAALAFDATVYPTFIMLDKYGNVRYRGKCPDAGKVEEWAASLAAETKDPGAEVALFGAVTLDPKRLLAQTKLPELRGGEKVLKDTIGENGLMIVFVDTTCPFSGTALKDMPSVAKTLSIGKINSVLINIQDSEETVKEHFKDFKSSIPLLYDVTANTKHFWNIRSVPTVVYIDPDGKIGYNGKAVWADLGRAIEKSRGLKAGSIKFSAKGTAFG